MADANNDGDNGHQNQVFVPIVGNEVIIPVVDNVVFREEGELVENQLN